jgi:hypothetical protein
MNRLEDFLQRYLCVLSHGALAISDYGLLFGERHTWKGMKGSGRGKGLM